MKKTIFYLFLAFLAGCSNHERSDAYGNFEATEITVSSQANGQLLTFEVKEGIYLEKGQPVGLVDTVDLYLKLSQLRNQESVLDAKMKSIRAQIDVTKQQIKNIEIERKRVKNLFDDGAATRRQLDDVNGKYDLLQAQLEAVRVQAASVDAEKSSLKAQEDQVKESLKKCRIINPTAGTVLTKYANAGEVVAYGKPLYKIADIGYLELKIFVSGAQLPGIKIGQKVQVLIDRPDETLEELTGEVSWVSPEAEFTPKTIQTRDERVNLVYAVKVRVMNDGKLKIGMPGEVNFNGKPEI